MRIRGVIFDLDGTLGDTLPICTEAFRSAAAPLVGREYTDEEIHATFGPSEEGAVHVLAPGHGEECLAAYLRHYEALHDACQAPFDGVRELLDALRARDVRLGLVTGKGPQSCAISLRRMGLEDDFSHVETGCPQGPCKPSKVRRILADWQIPPREVAYVGDAPSDVDTARATDLWALGAAWGSMTNPDKIQAKNPDALFREVRELREWLLRG
jgi:phosphoglycolate phosphatase/pyrophosphatase PpaX